MAIRAVHVSENVQNRPSRYPGCGKELADGFAETINYFNALHAESLEIFRRLMPDDLNKKCVTPGGVPITTWKWLRAMVEHEVHHRGQLFIYLSILGAKTTPLYGLTSEEVLGRSQP